MAAGKKTGGRKKGSKNKKASKASIALERLSDLTKGGEMPLDYMLRVMRDEDMDRHERHDMAKAAANYCHPRLSTIDHGNKDGNALVVKILD